MKKSVKYVCVGLGIVCCMGIHARLQAHEIQEKAIEAKHFALREKYDACLQRAGKTASAQKHCRKAYAEQRFFTVEHLYHWHMEHPLEADSLYKDKLIGLTGTVQRVGKTMLGVPELVLSLDAYGMRGVRVEFSKQFLSQIEALQAGQLVTLMGICKGMEAEDFVRVIHGEFME